MQTFAPVDRIAPVLGWALLALLAVSSTPLSSRSAAVLAILGSPLHTRLAVNLAIALFAAFFLLRDADPIMRAVRRLLPMREPGREALVRRAAEFVTVGVTSAPLVATVQGLLGGLAFWPVGLPAPVFWGVMMGGVLPAAVRRVGGVAAGGGLPDRIG